MPWYLWFILVIGMIIFISWASKDKTEKKPHDPNRLNFLTSLIKNVKYIAGHPLLNVSISNLYLYIDVDSLKFYDRITDHPNYCAEIKFSSIKDITVEDAKTIEHRVTATRLFAIGIFAFALKKKKIHELAYLSINWSNNQFTHETIFEFEGKDAMNRANTIRNSLIRAITHS